MRIKKEYRGLFNRKYAVDREIIRLVNEEKLDIVITDLDTGQSLTATL
jgi:hypothetical protein